jgi:hypothetical protein
MLVENHRGRSQRKRLSPFFPGIFFHRSEDRVQCNYLSWINYQHSSFMPINFYGEQQLVYSLIVAAKKYYEKRQSHRLWNF